MIGSIGIDVYTAWWGFQAYFNNAYSSNIPYLIGGVTALLLAEALPVALAIVAVSAIASGYISTNGIRIAMEFNWAGGLNDYWTW